MAATATGAQTKEKTEKDWAKDNPDPRDTANGDLLTLWNFPVAKSDLSPEHKEAIKKFLSFEALSGSSGRTEVEVNIRGHASDTGADRSNIDLARARAEQVAKNLRELGIQKIDVSWAGSGEPLDRGSSGSSFASNRRVDLRKFTPSPPVPSLPPVDPVEPPAKPEPTPAKNLGPSIVSFDIPIKVKLPPIKTAELIGSGEIEGTLTVKIDDKGGGWSGGAVLGGKGLSAKLEAEIAKSWKGKLSLQPPNGGKPAKLKFGVINEDWPMFEGGLQLSEKFVYFNGTMAERKLPELVLGDLHITLTLKVKLKTEWGPGPAMKLRLARAAGPVAAVAVPIVIAMAILGGTIYAIDQATQEGLRSTQLVTRRLGASARVAWEILYEIDSTKIEFMESQKNIPPVLLPNFNQGVNDINLIIKREKDRPAKRTEWQAKFAADGSRDFKKVRDTVFRTLGGNDNRVSMEDVLRQL